MELLHHNGQQNTENICVLSRIAEVNAENIHSLARIAEIRERRLTDLESQ
jgi:hypothetical protein